jgi:hypothetical protein
MNSKTGPQLARRTGLISSDHGQSPDRVACCILTTHDLTKRVAHRRRNRPPRSDVFDLAPRLAASQPVSELHFSRWGRRIPHTIGTPFGVAGWVKWITSEWPVIREQWISSREQESKAVGRAHLDLIETIAALLLSLSEDGSLWVAFVRMTYTSFVPTMQPPRVHSSGSTGSLGLRSVGIVALSF